MSDTTGLPYRLTAHGFEVQIFTHVVSFAFPDDYASGVRKLDAGVTISLPVEVIPEALRFLGDLSGEQLEPRVTRYIEPQFEPTVSIESQFGAPALEQIAVMQAELQSTRA